MGKKWANFVNWAGAGDPHNLLDSPLQTGWTYMQILVADNETPEDWAGNNYCVSALCSRWSENIPKRLGCFWESVEQTWNQSFSLLYSIPAHLMFGRKHHWMRTHSVSVNITQQTKPRNTTGVIIVHNRHLCLKYIYSFMCENQVKNWNS